MRYLISTLINVISQLIFLNQSSFKSNIIDLVNSGFKRKDFKIIRGNIDIRDLRFDSRKAKIRKGLNKKGEFFTEQYLNSTENDIFQEISRRHNNEITDYLGRDFKKDQVLFFKNFNIPKYLETHDIYSNIWHLDSHDGYLLIKIFLLLEDVGRDDGPFHFLDRKHTKKYFSQLRERWTFAKFKELPRFKEEVSFTGKKGDYIIINTANCMHRASIPSKSREMAQLTIKPKWRI